MLTLEDLKKEVEYKPLTGLFYRLKTHRTVKRGDIAGGIHQLSQHSKAYIRIGILGKYYSAHRLAWFYMTGYWPSEDIDHINQDSLDNRWINLRECSHQENGKNQKKYINNTSGVVGVHLRSSGKWRARIFHKGKHINLGHFDSFDDAVTARNAANKELGFHENHGQ